MEDKIVLITGSTTGIGKQTAIDLIKMGAHVIIHGRNQEKSLKTLKELKSKFQDNKLDAVHADLSSFQQIQDMSKQLHEKYSYLDVLINNAGVFKNKRQITQEGYEETFAINVLSPFLVTYYMIDLLKKNQPSRIVNVSSRLQSSDIDFENLHGEKSYHGYSAYGLSKSCLNMITFEIAEKLKDSGITVNCLHPGGFKTQMNNYQIGIPASMGSKTLIYVASSPELGKISGKYFQDMKQTKSADITYNIEIRTKLWQICEELTKVFY